MNIITAIRIGLVKDCDTCQSQMSHEKLAESAGMPNIQNLTNSHIKLSE